MRNKIFYIYILTNLKNKTLYIGITNNLERRIYEHKNELLGGFTKKYKLKKLVYYEEFKYIKEALAREKQLKNWHREWKINLIKQINPEFNDLAEDWYDIDPETSSPLKRDRQDDRGGVLCYGRLCNELQTMLQMIYEKELIN